MFTGIIQKVLPLEEFSISGDGAKLAIDTGYSGIEEGESIAINGVCLTVSKCNTEGWASFYLSPETMARTNLGSLKKGSLLNLERSLRLGDRISGHFVYGHVDLTAKLEKSLPQGDAYLLSVLLPSSALPYCIEKGSIAIDGVSLTINKVVPSGDFGEIFIQLIPHTWKHTRFSELSSGDFINIELDSLAKYVEKQCKTYKELLNN